MKRIGLIAVLLLGTGCAAKKVTQAIIIRPIKEVAKDSFCDVRDNEGNCLHWAKHKAPCTYNDQTGGCSEATK